MKTTRLIPFLVLLFSIKNIDAQTLQQVTDNGSTTSNDISAATVSANVSSLFGSDLPTNISMLNGYKINGSIGNVSHNGITYQSGGGGGAAIGFFRGGSYDTNIDFYTNSYNSYGTLQHRMRIDNNGNVGIGISLPQSILHIISSSFDIGATCKSGQGLLIESKTGGRFQNKGAELEFVIPANTDGTNPWAQGRIVTVAGNSLDGSAVGKMILGTKRLFNKIGGGHEWLYGDDIVIDGVGNIGLGTLIPREKLSVNGNIRAKEIKVEASPWPDYVFTKDYRLPTLQEIENHIREKGHLPGIPTAEEVKTNGIDLGEMNAKHLQKIEELTLHLIKLKEHNDALEKNIDQQNKEFRNEIQYLKSKIK